MDVARAAAARNIPVLFVTGARPDGVQALVGHLARLIAPAAGRSFLSDLMQVLDTTRDPALHAHAAAVQAYRHRYGV